MNNETPKRERLDILTKLTLQRLVNAFSESVSENKFAIGAPPMNHPNISLKACPCGRKVVSPLTDCATGARLCHHCAPPSDDLFNAICVSKKMQDLFDGNNLNEKSYPLDERMRNLKGDWTRVQ
jgi:hypothetical protein